MDEAKKNRTNIARKVARKSNELDTAVRADLHISEIQEKIGTLKYCMEELGTAQDEYLLHFDPNTDGIPAKIDEEEKWYMNYDAKTNDVIKKARSYIERKKTPSKSDDAKQVKLKKIEVPSFSGNVKDFYKWKSIFERYMKNIDNETKYDYLLTSTAGEARKFVENKATYGEAMARLDEKYGNIHVIMGILINDVKSLQIVRKGDFKSFEQLSLKVDEFYDRLKLMGKEDDVENSYVLKEIESKLCYEDMQRWLESMGENVDQRKVQHLMEWLERQAHLRRITQNNQGISTSRAPPLPANRYSNSRISGSISASDTCLNCTTGNHKFVDCPEYLKLSIDDRWERVKLFRVCFVCLKRGHRREECSEATCNVCSRPHHITLHKFLPNNSDSMIQQFGSSSILQDNSTEQQQLEKPSPLEQNVTNSAKTKRVNLARSFLPVLRAHAFSKNRGKQCTIALDSFSEINIITSRCAAQLGLIGDPLITQITGAGGVETVTKSKLVVVNVVDKMNVTHKIECVVLPKACGKTKEVNKEQFGKSEHEEIKKRNIYTRGGEVEILIGMSQPLLHTSSMQPFVNKLCIMETRFGDTLVGADKKDQIECEYNKINSTSITVLPDHPDEVLWRNHLQSELAGISPVEQKKSEEDKKFDQETKINTLEEAENKRLEVSLAWKTNPEKFENNRKQAEESDHRLRKQLERDRTVENLFDKQLCEMIEMEILKRVPMNFPKRYLPVLAVIDLERESTKVRFCLDAKRKFNGTSFNDYLFKGKIEMNGIFEMLTGFRSGYIAMQGDIKKMFWQIKLSEYDQQFHGIIYKGETFVFTRVCFGDKPSPTIADVCMRKIAEEEKDNLPSGSEVIKNKRFVDDLLDAGTKATTMIKKRDEVSELLGRYGFQVKEWRSNALEVGKIKEDGKVLGMPWNGKEDVLLIKLKKIAKFVDFTKINVLKRIAGVWDPMGLIAGLMTNGKLIFQCKVRMKLEWDEIYHGKELTDKWNKWLCELEKCDGLCIPRSILPSCGDLNEMKFELIGFGDGSSVACGAAVYLRWSDMDEKNVEIKFLGAKGKLNPIKGTTVPRSELCGALLTSKIVKSVELSLENTEIKEHYKEKLLFSDSTTVLSWLKSASMKFKPFVKNKVLECQELHPINVWNFIPGRENTSADLISKGCEFKDLDKIISGPDILKLPRERWPEQPNETDEVEINAEKCANINVISTAVDENVIDISRFSSWKKLVRTTAYCQKYIKMRISKQNTDIIEDDNILPNLSDEEIKNGEIYWIRKAQKNLDLTSSKVKQLSPFTDENGIIRVSGRLKNMPVFDENRKHPILLPKDHPISRLITIDAHEECIHPGHLRVMAEVRKTYWIIGLRVIAKSIGRKCTICRRWRNSSMEQKMADLPAFRLDAYSRPFENVSIDYFGPLSMKYGYRSRTKAFGVIFTCLTTRAIHTELATDLSTDTFLLAFDRFVALYKKPKFVRSDNGSNFIGAANELKEMIRLWKTDTEERKKLINMCNKYGIKWTFSTPLASHHNGAVEIMVKTVKSSLNKLLTEQVYREEEYRTIFAKVTGIVNSRPLWPVSEGDIDQPPITPNDLLRPTGQQRDPDDVELNLSTNPRKRFDHIQNVCDNWWRIWLLHFTPNLQRRNKWYKERKDISEGDIVLLIDPTVKRSQWNMGIVEKTYKGSDDRTRSVSVRTRSETYDRPITKLTLLISKEEQMEQ